MDYDQNNDRLVGYRVLNNDQNNDRLVGVFCSKNKMLSYNVHKFTISITIIRSQSVHSTHIHDVLYYYGNVILPFGIYIIYVLYNIT